MLKLNINFLIPAHTCQVPLPFLTHTRYLYFLFFSSSNSTFHPFFLFFSGQAPLPSSPMLLPFPQPSCQKSKILFPLTEPKTPFRQTHATHHKHFLIETTWYHSLFCASDPSDHSPPNFSLQRPQLPLFLATHSTLIVAHHQPRFPG